MLLFLPVLNKCKLDGGYSLFIWLLLVAWIRPVSALKIEETWGGAFMSIENINFQTHLNPIEKKAILRKVTQGQVPVYNTPDLSLYENIHGLKEAIYQSWIKSDSIWVNYLKKSYTVDSQDNLTKVTTWQVNDSTGTFKNYLETEIEYHSKGHVSKATEKYYFNNKWVLNIQLTIEYNEIDSPITFQKVRWDSSQSKWSDKPVQYGTYTYGPNGKVSRKDIETLYDNGYENRTVWFTYLPDGRIYSEEKRVPSGIAKRIHQYPDPYTEIVTSIDDSTIIYYNRAGLIDSTLLYYLPVYPKNGIERDQVIYDNQGRPLFRYLSYSPDSGHASSWIVDARITYYYNDNYVKGNSKQQKKAGNLNWHKIAEHALVFEGLPESFTPASVEIFNLAGVTLQKDNVIATAERSVQIRLNDFLPEGYYMFRIRQGNTSKYIGLQLP